MKLLLVHPSCLMYSEVYLRLEPLGLALVAAAAEHAGHDVRVVDLQVLPGSHLERQLRDWRPQAVGFSLNYLANVPEVLHLAQLVRRSLPEAFVFIGGHSASFTAAELLEHAAGNVDCVVRGEGEAITPRLLEVVAQRGDVGQLPGVVTAAGSGPPPQRIGSLDELRPARHLLTHRRRYFIGEIDPCASIEFSRGCPWDCTFCSAWTFYGRSYRKVAPAAAADDLQSIREPGVFIVDDVAFVHPEHGHALADEIARRRIRKQYYLETRGDVLLRNREVFRRWHNLGLKYMFLGLEALDEQGLQQFRKRTSVDKNYAALELARSMGITVAVNLIVDPAWDERRFEVVRQWAVSVPEIVHLTVNTPYPGTETWTTESRRFTTRDYRLFDVQHAVLPTKLPLAEFYRQLVATQHVLNRKHLGLAALRKVLGRSLQLLLRGQTNFLTMLWKFSSVYNAQRQIADHHRPIDYQIRLPDEPGTLLPRESLYVHPPEPAAT